MGYLGVEHNVNGDSIRDELHRHCQLVRGWLVRLLEYGRRGRNVPPASLCQGTQTLSGTRARAFL